MQREIPYMLTIRMQRTGRKANAQFRIIVQDSRFTPTSGRVVAQLGHYDPHTKEVVLDAEKATQYLKNGAQPSERVVRLFQVQKIAMPDWVDQPRTDRTGKVRNGEKLRKNQPKAEVVAEEPAPKPTEEAPAEEPATEVPAEDVTEAPAETAEPKEAEVTEAPAEVTKVESAETAEEVKEA